MTLQVFISYKSEYRDFARAVKGQLNQWGFQTWLDVDNIQPGDYFRHKIQQGLDSSDVLLMVLTEEAQLSREVMSEVDYFLDVAKKPVVPLRHRECKPLYIFVSIQYIDFVTDQANGYVQLKQRLGELAASIPLPTPTTDDGIVSAQKPGAPASSASEADTKRRESIDSSDLFGAIGGTMPEPEPAESEEPYQELEESVQEEKQKKEELLDDVLSVTKPPKPITAASPPPSPVRPQPMTEQTPAPIPALPPAAPQMQPQRQQEYIPQPAALGRRKSNPIRLLAIAVVGFSVTILAIIASSPNRISIDATLTSAYIASLATNNAAFTYVPTVTITAGATTTLNAEQTRVAELTALHLQTPTSTPSPGIVDRLGGAPIVATLFGLIIVSVLALMIFMLRYFRRSKPAAKPSNTEAEQSLLGGIQATNRESILNISEKLWLNDETLPALKSGALLKHKDYPDYPLPPNANILDVFNDLNRELLILGAPRGGKTVLLHQLASKLITQSQQDTTKAIPVVFDLSSWAAERKPLADWLVDELRQQYQVPKTTAQTWIEGEKLLLLLDGLDEVAEQYRNDCVDAINTFRQKYRTVDLAICSRVADYDALTSKLDIRGAVVIQ